MNSRRSTSSSGSRIRTHRVRVLYGDTDQMGVAYYANFFRWFELARNEYLRDTGTPYRALEAEGVRLPVTEAYCRYLRPARYDDLLALESWIDSLGHVRVRFAYRVLRTEGGESLAEGHTVHACLAPDGTPRRLTKSLLVALETPSPPDPPTLL